MNHEADSLAALVENLVKNWEIEASFKRDLNDCRTMDNTCYTFSVNGGPPQCKLFNQTIYSSTTQKHERITNDDV
jgi:hypothetical protein